MNQTQENGKKPNFGTDFGPILGHQIFFKDLALSVTRYHGQLSSCTTEKTNDPILRKLREKILTKLLSKNSHKYNKTGLNISLLWKILLEWDRYILPTSGLAKHTHSYINIKKEWLEDFEEIYLQWAGITNQRIEMINLT